MRIVAGLLTAWIAWRWIGFAVGFVRVQRFEGPVRREARRTVIARGAWNVFLSVGMVYLWAALAGRQPSDVLVGFLAAALMCSLAVGIAAGFMQPEERTPETLSICRVGRLVENEERPSAKAATSEEPS